MLLGCDNATEIPLKDYLMVIVISPNYYLDTT